MKIAIFGLGYVGFTALCCLAREGHEVIGFDVNNAKVDGIRSGVPPVFEPGLDEMLSAGLRDGRISVFTGIGGHLDACEIAIVCVGTPSGTDGAHDMRFIAEVSRQIATHIRPTRYKPLTIIYRATVRPGTMEEFIIPIFRAALGDWFGQAVEVVYNPEFLRESFAVSDYFAPPKIVIGTADGLPSARTEKLYSAVKAPRFITKFAEAEITKFVDNTWHAVKVSFANEIGRVCLQIGISAAKVHEIFVSDTKLNISDYYTRPGGAFGGACLPKDVRALQHLSGDRGVNTPLIDAVLRSNDAHKFCLLQQVTQGLKPGASILLAGIAFKDGTDDLRESPNVDLARSLLRQGYALSIFDPAVDASKLMGANLGYAWSHLPQLTRLLISKSQAEARRFDRIVAANKTIRLLSLHPKQNVVDISSLD